MGERFKIDHACADCPCEYQCCYQFVQGQLHSFFNILFKLVIKICLINLSVRVICNRNSDFFHTIIYLIIQTFTVSNIDIFCYSGEGGWSPWSHGPCSHTCGNGTRTNTRNCTTPDHPDCCPGSSTLVEACEERSCTGNMLCLALFQQFMVVYFAGVIVLHILIIT